MAVAAATVRGQGIPPVTYSLDFATDFNLLLDPNDPIAQHFAMWKTPAQLASLRSAPMIRLTNHADSQLDLTQLRLDLGDLNYRFDSFAFLETPDDGPAVVTSHSDSTFGGDMQPFIVIEFPNGLAPGDSMTFQVRLANLIGPGLANYENVLWDSDEALFQPDRSDNALVTVIAGNLSQTQPVSISFIPVRLFEYPMASANFPTDAAGATGFSMLLPDSEKMSMVVFQHFEQVIPEPSSWALALGACVGVLVTRRKRRL
jgi:hypothetical protein